MAPQKALKVQDEVRVKGTDAFNLDWLKDTYPSTWMHEKFEGIVAAKDGAKWKIDFTDGESATLARGKIEFLKRPEVIVQEHEEEDSYDDGSAAEGPMVDSSEEEEGIHRFFDEEADHDSVPTKTGKKTDTIDLTAGWVRDDEFCDDQRPASKTQHGPILNDQPDPAKTPLFELIFLLGCKFLPINTFFEPMATAMTADGARRYKEGHREYLNWNVSVNDLLQFIGIWIYMLAFHQPGSRDQYWQEPKFGPRHRLVEWLRLGENGEKNEKWFRKMNETFTLPAKPGSKASDPFIKTRFFWECLRDAFFAAVVASWLLVLDESMVKWMGHGMPGLMVILRKPTPIGLELHTLCCALSGILVWFEIYEGKDAMALKEYNNEYPKSIALTLRMLEPFFGSGRVLVADSWFGSVACAIALFRHGIHCVMNVKTATKNFPKEEMMEVVGEIKGTGADAKKARRERRGTQIAFTQRVKIGAKELILLAAGHNKKVPLLLICTAFTMLAGKTHNKVWKVNEADGSVSLHEIKTPQPEVHALYRLWMNIVDVHNKLRQGVISMADVWPTTDWAKRHFAEGIGFWEVNVFKAIIYFYPQYRHIDHGEFRARLAWAFMTLGRVPYPEDASAGSASSSATPAPGTLPSAPLPGGEHQWVPTENKRKKQCSYCDRKCYQRCETCARLGIGVFHACGTLTGRDCMAQHVHGVQPSHGSWYMSSPGRRTIVAGKADKKRKDAEGNVSDSDDSEDEACPIGGPTMQSPRLKAKRAREKAAKRAAKQAKAAAEAAEKKASDDAGRAVRATKCAIDAEA